MVVDNFLNSKLLHILGLHVQSSTGFLLGIFDAATFHGKIALSCLGAIMQTGGEVLKSDIGS
jgi:hypothetical protein